MEDYRPDGMLIIRIGIRNQSRWRDGRESGRTCGSHRDSSVALPAYAKTPRGGPMARLQAPAAPGKIRMRDDLGRFRVAETAGFR